MRGRTSAIFSTRNRSAINPCFRRHAQRRPYRTVVLTVLWCSPKLRVTDGICICRPATSVSVACTCFPGSCRAPAGPPLGWNGHTYLYIDPLPYLRRPSQYLRSAFPANFQVHCTVTQTIKTSRPLPPQTEADGPDFFKKARQASRTASALSRECGAADTPT